MVNKCKDCKYWDTSSIIKQDGNFSDCSEIGKYASAEYGYWVYATRLDFGCIKFKKIRN